MPRQTLTPHALISQLWTLTRAVTGGGGGALADVAGAQRGLYSEAASSCFFSPSCSLVTLNLNHFQTTPSKLLDAVLSRLIPNTPLAILGSPTSQMSNISVKLLQAAIWRVLHRFRRKGGCHAVNITMCCSGVRSLETPDWQQQQRDADCGDLKGGLNFSRRTGLHGSLLCFFFRRSDTFSVNAALSSFV